MRDLSWAKDMSTCTLLLKSEGKYWRGIRQPLRMIELACFMKRWDALLPFWKAFSTSILPKRSEPFHSK